MHKLNLKTASEPFANSWQKNKRRFDQPSSKILQFISICLGLLLATLSLGSAAQERYPSRTVRIIVPWGPGTPPDVAARVVASKLPELLKQPVIVENRPGASGTIGLAEVARSPADGYTIGALHYSTAAIASLYPQFKVDLVKDMKGVGQMEWGHNILVVSPSLGVKTVAELIEYVKRNPSTFASAGVGTPAHLSGVMFQRATNTEATHIPYNQFGQAVLDVSTGRVTYMVLAAPAAVPQILGGKLLALAVTGPTRNSNVRDIPTVSELKLASMQSRTWSGLVVRSDTPKEVIDRLSRDIASVMAMPEVRESLAKQQIEIPMETTEQFRDLIRKDVEFGANFVRVNGIKLD
ncbi:MAG: tripartite tricarboxylate transporter substrate binding protein [Comamonadaceae bacterium]|nr:MAG: tripartite tricarboxylate transporter substrate binding protein [Comamonadaceae bacterium]